MKKPRSNLIPFSQSLSKRGRADHDPMDRLEKRVRVDPMDHFVDEVEDPWYDIDVRVEDLGQLQESMAPVFEGLKDQWGGSSRVGTVYAYLDQQGLFCLTFQSREPFRAEGGLEEVPQGHLPTWMVNKQANASDSSAEEAARLMVTLPSEIDPNDPRWKSVIKALEILRS